MWNPLSWVMKAAAIMAIALANGNGKPPDWQDFIGIVCLLFINSTISFIEENNAGNVAAALMAGLAPKTKCNDYPATDNVHDGPRGPNKKKYPFRPLSFMDVRRKTSSVSCASVGLTKQANVAQIRSCTLGEYTVGGDSRTCTASSDSVGQPRKKKFSSPRCDCGSYAIIFQSCTKINPDRFFLGCPNYNTSRSHCNYFHWLDMMVEENIEETSSGRNAIFMARRLRELEQRVIELEFGGKDGARGYQGNKCICLTMMELISILFVLAIKGMF
ncbi:hypothetical protein PIB30_013749 [Stylosanthes scabra]|uniref:Zinc finger GRF-type domain-containing protein n=1 Tax=Stylosanthes scabra TaxID=79078 RepID=A0ABU6Y8F4_9FABA|nr:hypothetical protein [Stylosanthes scabra]